MGFPELVRYMMSGPIVAMVWTGLNIVPIVRSMVGATKPSDAAPGSIRGDFCIDVGRNLIHASDSSEAAQKEVAMWFTNEEICQWRPCSLEWIYEDEVVAEENQKTPKVDKIEANAGGAGASADGLKKLKDLELENKDLKKVTSDLKAMIVKLEGRVAAIEKAKPAAAYAAKKSKKPALIAKTSVLLDCKPWDDETDMDVMLKEIKKIEMDGLVWGANKLVPVGYGISKLQVMIVVEDLKVSIEELQEKICEIED